MLYGTQRNPPRYAPFSFLFYNKLALPSRQAVDILLYCFIVVLEDNHETNFHFIFVWTIELKIIQKSQNFLVRNRPKVEYSAVFHRVKLWSPSMHCVRRKRQDTPPCWLNWPISTSLPCGSGGLQRGFWLVKEEHGQKGTVWLLFLCLLFCTHMHGAIITCTCTCSCNSLFLTLIRPGGGGGGGIHPPLDFSRIFFFHAPRFRDFFLSSLAQLLMLFL